MIPALLLVGLVFGKWWRISIPAATIGWAVLLLGTRVVSDLAHFWGAAWFGFMNVAIGVLMFQAGRLVFLGARRAFGRVSTHRWQSASS